MPELEQRIIAFTAKERGMKPDRIHLSSRLSHDLGMEGDDAVEFFEKFSKEFDVDLVRLGDHWHLHFGPEGSAPPLGCMVVIGAAVILGSLLHEAFKPIADWIWMILLVGGFGWIYTRFFIDQEPSGVVPVTVSDLVDAAKEGRWIKQYDGSA
jgi:hypothetical protein